MEDRDSRSASGVRMSVSATAADPNSRATRKAPEPANPSFSIRSLSLSLITPTPHTGTALVPIDKFKGWN